MQSARCELGLEVLCFATPPATPHPGVIFVVRVDIDYDREHVVVKGPGSINITPQIEEHRCLHSEENGRVKRNLVGSIW